MGYMQISRPRPLKKSNGIRRNSDDSDEWVAKVTRWTSFAKDCNFSLHIWVLANISYLYLDSEEFGPMQQILTAFPKTVALLLRINSLPSFSSWKTMVSLSSLVLM